MDNENRGKVMTTLTDEDMKATGAKCCYEGCEKLAETIASGREYHREPQGHPIGYYCMVHARIVEDEGNPEYTDSCPNCGCMHGIN